MPEKTRDEESKSGNNFGIHWIHAEGKLDTKEENFTPKNRSQTTFLTHLGGAVILSLDGSWEYLLNQKSVSFDETTLVNDQVKIDSIEGLVHQLSFDIELKENAAIVCSVHYTKSLDKEIENETQVQEQIKGIDEETMKADTAESETLLDVESLVHKEEKTELINEGSDESQSKELDTPVEDDLLLKVQALMNARDSIDISEIEFTGDKSASKRESIQEEQNSEEEVESKVVQAQEKEDEEQSLKGKIRLDQADASLKFSTGSYVEGFTLKEDGSFVYEPDKISHSHLELDQSQSYPIDIEVKGSDSSNLKGSIEVKVVRKGGNLDLSFVQGPFTLMKEEVNENPMALDELTQGSHSFEDHHKDHEPEAMDGHLAVVFDSLDDGAQLHSDGTLGVTIILPRGALSGEAIIINGSEFVITEAEAEVGKLLYSVYPDDELEVSFRDSDNNISDSVRAKANEKSVEIIEFLVAPKLMGEVGSQSMHASIGAPDESGLSWGIKDGHSHISHYVEGEFGSVHIDAQTGELEYKYTEHSGLQKYGNSADNKVNENFILCLEDKDYAQLEVSLHIQAQSIHGYSGHQIDSSTIEEMHLLKLDPSEPKEDHTQMIQMLRGGLESNKAKISELMMEIYTSKSKGGDVSEAKKKLQLLTNQKVHLEDKLSTLK